MYYSVLNNILDKSTIHVERRFKTMGGFRFEELLNSSLFHSDKKNPMEEFSILDLYKKNILELDGLKCELKSVYATNFAKQASSIQEVAEIIRHLEVN